MAKDTGNSDAGLFNRVEKKQLGYSTAEVDAFMAHARTAYNGHSTEPLTAAMVQTADFEVIEGGYDPGQVDDAMDRLEDAIIAKERNQFIASRGEAAWIRHLDERSRVLKARLGRPAGRRFRRPVDAKSQGYRCADVDQFMDRLHAFLVADQALTVNDIRQAVFDAAVGEQAYDEAQVDTFLNRFVELAAAIQ